MSEAGPNQSKVGDSGLIAPPAGGAILNFIRKLREPYRPKQPFTLPNKPALIDPMVTLPQICLIVKGDVVGQCNAPDDENDYHAWQEVLTFLRHSVAVQKRNAN